MSVALGYSYVKNGVILGKNLQRPRVIGSMVIGTRHDVTQYGYYPEVQGNVPATTKYELLYDQTYTIDEGGKRVVVDFAVKKKDIPDSITMRQMRLGLLANGKLADVEAAIALAGPEAEIEWNFSATIERGHFLIGFIKDALGVTNRQFINFVIDAAER